MSDLWKQIPGFPNYEACKDGRIRSKNFKVQKLNRWGTITEFTHKGKVLKPWVNKHGYHYMSLGQEITKEVHYFIALTFIGPKLPDQEVNHKNGLKFDNSYENLEWVTRSKNIQHAFDNNLNHSGSKHGISKLTEENVTEIKKLIAEKKPWSRPFYIDIANQYGVDRKTIQSIAKNKTWKNL